VVLAVFVGRGDSLTIVARADGLNIDTQAGLHAKSGGVACAFRLLQRKVVERPSGTLRWKLWMPILSARPGSDTASKPIRAPRSLGSRAMSREMLKLLQQE
jgi:hypothetical protein